MTFKRGDIVRCVEANGGVLTFGKLYAVMGLGAGVVVINDKGAEANYHYWRFELVNYLPACPNCERLRTAHEAIV